MRWSGIISVILIMSMPACVDRLHTEFQKSDTYSISIDGFISDQPGPYRIQINTVFDIESVTSTKRPVSAKHVVISDNTGTHEELTEISPGVYETTPNGIRGKVGGVYTLLVELLNGSTYQSMPDTLLSTGQVDIVYYSFTRKLDKEGAKEYGFDIFSNSSANAIGQSRFMWKLTGTFQSETHPENMSNPACNPLPSGKCNYALICSGFLNIGSQANPELVRVKPCECCTCWYKLFNPAPVLSDLLYSSSLDYTGIKIHHIPLNGWIFMHKVHAEVSQMSLSQRAYKFWKAIRDQKAANGNLFQPISGKIPVNFVQQNGEAAPVQGLFYATAVSSKAIYINRTNVPPLVEIPSVEGLGNISCLELFPNATTVKPSYWKE